MLEKLIWNFLEFWMQDVTETTAQRKPLLIKVHVFKATWEVLLALAQLPELLLKMQPAVLQLSLLLCDAGGQCRMEMRQLGHTHVQHLPQTGLQVRQRRLLQPDFLICWRVLLCISHYSLPWSGRQCHASLCLQCGPALWMRMAFSSKPKTQWVWTTHGIS